MAYSGSTASTTLANPARLITDGGLYGRSGGVNGTTSFTTAPAEPNAQGGRLWSYMSTNKTTDMNIAGNAFFGDGDDLGMAGGDSFNLVPPKPGGLECCLHRLCAGVHRQHHLIAGKLAQLLG